MGISKVLLFRQVIYHKSIHPLCQMEIIRFANSFLSFHKQEIRDFIETTATLPPRLLNAESAEKESLQATAIEHPWLCYCKVGKKPLRKDSLVSCLGYPSGWFCKTHAAIIVLGSLSKKESHSSLSRRQSWMDGES
jgi:hypothetical protein